MVFTLCSHDKFVCPKISQVTGGSSKNGHEQLDGDYRYDHGHRTNPSCLRGLYASLRLEFVGRSLSVLKLWSLLLYMVCIGWFGGSFCWETPIPRNFFENSFVSCYVLPVVQRRPFSWLTSTQARTISHQTFVAHDVLGGWGGVKRGDSVS